MDDLILQLKKSTLETVENSKPAAFFCGIVESESPLKIKIDEKITLEEEQLILTPSVKDTELNLSLSMFTEMCMDVVHSHAYIDYFSDDGKFAWRVTAPANNPHRHLIIGKTTAIMHNKLKEGENVFLIRLQGGNKFLVLCRVLGDTSDYFSSMFG